MAGCPAGAGSSANSSSPTGDGGPVGAGDPAEVGCHASVSGLIGSGGPAGACSPTRPRFRVAYKFI